MFSVCQIIFIVRGKEGPMTSYYSRFKDKRDVARKNELRLYRNFLKIALALLNTVF